MAQDARKVVRPRIEIGGSFSLVDHHGVAVTDRSWPGRYLLVFFGFTHCKVVCPRALAKLDTVLDLLGPAAQAIRPLYVTVDPERDTPERMRVFLADHPHFLGLTGPRESIDHVKAAYRVFAERQKADDGGDYDVPHSAITYLMAPDGTLAGHFVDALDAETIAGRVRTLVAQAAGRTASFDFRSDKNNPI